MMKKSLFCMTAAFFALPTVTFAASPYFSFKDGDGFKRFSVSAGWLHAMPQGSANPVNINTSVAEGTTSKVGSVSKQSVLNAADRSSNPSYTMQSKFYPQIHCLQYSPEQPL